MHTPGIGPPCCSWHFFSHASCTGFSNVCRSELVSTKNSAGARSPRGKCQHRPLDRAKVAGRQSEHSGPKSDGGSQRLVPVRFVRSKLGSLSNRALLVNNLIDLALCAGNRVVSAVGAKPPHDGRSRVRPPKVLRAVRIGRNEPTRMASPTSRQGHRDSTSEECTNTVNSLLDLWRYGVLSVGLNAVPDFHIA